MHLAIAGIRGIPNNYGGFETLAEYLVEYLAMDIARQKIWIALLAAIREQI